MASRFTVSPIAIKKELEWTDPENGELVKFWIRIKKRLSVGEARGVQTAGWRGVKQQGQEGDTEIAIDWKGMTFARVAEYLVGWSLTDDKENLLPLKVETLQSLDESLYDVIEKAISEHVKAMEEEKKVRTGSNEPVPTLA